MKRAKKIKTNKIINYISLLFLLILLIYSFQYAKVSNKYSIYNIVVSGNSFVNNDFIKSVVQKNINNKNIFNINIDLINKEIIENDFIETSKIYITFPSTISIVVKEINPIALFSNDNQNYLIDGNLNKINANINSINHYSVPIISFENYNEEDIIKTTNILKFIITKNLKLYESIQEINIKSEFSYMTINNNTYIKLNKNNIKNDTYKLIQFINDIKDKKNINTYKYVNVSIPNQIIVKERKI